MVATCKVGLIKSTIENQQDHVCHISHALDIDHGRSMSVVHLDTILQNAHLMGIAGSDYIPLDLKFHNSLDAFREFYVKKYIDHHSHEIAF